MFTRPVVLLTAFMLLLASAASSAAPTAKPALTVPIAGSFAGGVFSGRFELAEFVASGTQLAAHGTLIGTLTSAGGMPIGTVMKSVSIPVVASTAAGVSSAAVIQQVVGRCPILNLVLGPLHLDLLGLEVDLNQVVLDITAVSGAGNLLGNLLCAVTGLLDGVGALIQIADLLNQILSILTGLLG